MKVIVKIILSCIFFAWIYGLYFMWTKENELMIAFFSTAFGSVGWFWIYSIITENETFNTKEK